MGKLVVRLLCHLDRCHSWRQIHYRLNIDIHKLGKKDHHHIVHLGRDNLELTLFLHYKKYMWIRSHM